jgi:cobalt-zinc-cadmium efflux system outer membrane protein
VADPTALLLIDKTEPLTLEQCIELAELNNPVLKREMARITAASGDELQAGLLPNPRFDTNNPQVFAGTQTLLNAGFQQEIPVMGKKRLDRAAASVFTRQSQSNYNVTRYTLFGMVRSQFYQTLAAQQRVRLYQRLVELTLAAVETSRQRERAGVGNHIDTLMLNVDYQKVRADLARSEELMRGEQQQLTTLLGISAKSETRVAGHLFDPPPEFDEDQLREFVTGGNDFTRIAQMEIERTRILARRAEVEWIPNPTLGPAFQYGVTNGSEQFWFNITFPIPTRDRNQGNIISTRGDLIASMENLTSVQLDMLRQISELLNRHHAAVQQVSRYRTDVIPSTREALDLARNGFSNGLITTAIFLQAQRTFVETYLAYIDAQEEVWTTAADLSRLLQMDTFP